MCSSKKLETPATRKKTQKTQAAPAFEEMQQELDEMQRYRESLEVIELPQVLGGSNLMQIFSGKFFRGETPQNTGWMATRNPKANHLRLC